ncbi:MAG TPA: RbsD/FucU domain-containing protein [Acidothermaceae bacterium]|jgi:L-fucose mutarotase
MLKNLDPLLGPDLLHALAAMGHGDEVAVVDANYPAAATARRLIRLEGVDTYRAVQAILSVLPLDVALADPITRMQVVGDPTSMPAVQTEVLRCASDAEGQEIGAGAIDRFAFYERSRSAFVTVATGEARPYGCVLLTKGVIFGR